MNRKISSTCALFPWSLLPLSLALAAACISPKPTAPSDESRPDMDMEPPVKCGALTTCGQSCTELDSDPRNCGTCGRSCVIPNATASCIKGECAISACSEGFIDADGKIANGCELMSNCVAGKSCTTSCASSGLTSCVAGMAQCTPPAEICNGADDNCNGSCDEGALAGCRVGVHRSVGGGGHYYTTSLSAAMTPPYTLESANYFYLYQNQVPGTVPVYSCPKPSGLYFMTSSSVCEGLAIPGTLLGYWGSGSGCSGTSLYRLYNDKSGDHFYTTSDAEQMNAVSMFGYHLESVPGYVFATP